MMKKDNVLLSIIVPVYNVEKYLERCVNSLLHQDIDKSEYEIILVNDGSTDNSYEIANKLSLRFSNIHLISQTNSGQGKARNRGMEIARGRYIMFVDSDDQLLPGTLKDVLNLAIGSKAEVCAYGMIYFDENGERHYGAIQPFVAGRIYTGKYAILHHADTGSSCTYLFLREFLNKYKLTFLEGIYHEDVDFIMRIYALTDRMVFSNKTIYSYTYNSESTDRKIDFNKKLKQYRDEFIIIKHLRDFSIEYSIDSTLKNYYKKHGNSLIISDFIRLRNEKVFSKTVKFSVLNLLKEMDLYPIRGTTLSWKTSLLIPFFNIECLLIKYMQKK